MCDLCRFGDADVGNGRLVIGVLHFQSRDRLGADFDFRKHFAIVSGRQVGHESHLGAGNPDDVTGFQFAITLDTFVADGGSVSTAQVADCPFAIGQKYLGVLSASLIFLNDDLVGGRTSDCDGSTRHESKNI